jgi:HK97 family phage major capsid protein
MTPEQIAALTAEAAKRGAEAVLAAQAKALAEQKEVDAAAAKRAADADAALAAKRAAAKSNDLDEDTDDVIARAITGGASDGGSDVAREIRVVKDVREGSGLDFARLIKARAVVAREALQGHKTSLRQVLKDMGDERITRALSQSNFTGMGAFVQHQYANEVIPLLRNQTVIRKAGPRQITHNGGSLIFDRQTGDVTDNWSSETGRIAESEPTNDQIQFSEKKHTTLVVIPNDLLRNSNVDAEAYVRDSIIAKMAVGEDFQFIYGDGSQNKPLGIRKQLNSANLFAATAPTTAKTPTIAEAKKQLGKLKKKLKKANLPMQKPTWFFNADVELGIEQATGPGGEGANVLELEMASKSTLRKYPYFVSQQFSDAIGAGADGLSAGTATDLMLFDMAQVLIVDWMGLELEVFPNGTYNKADGSALSGISTDQTVIRAISKTDIGLLYDVAGVVAYGCDWGHD